jgi:hypothetical protein
MEDNGKGLGEGRMFERAVIRKPRKSLHIRHVGQKKTMDVRIEHMRRVVHTLLQRTIGMREDRSTATEAHGFAEIVSALFAKVALGAVYARFDCDTLTWNKVDTWSNCGDDTCCFVTKNQGCLDSEISVPSVGIIVYCAKSVSDLSIRKGLERSQSLPQRPVEAMET